MIWKNYNEYKGSEWNIMLGQAMEQIVNKRVITCVMTIV